MDINQFVKQLKLLQDENARLKSSHENYSTYAKELNAIGVKLISMSKELDPFNDQVGKKRIRTDFTQHVADFSNMLTNGTHVTMVLLKKAYPDLRYDQHMDIMTKLRALPNVKEVRDGLKLRLYI